MELVCKSCVSKQHHFLDFLARKIEIQNFAEYSGKLKNFENPVLQKAHVKA